MEDLQTRAFRGARLLDFEYPGWFESPRFYNPGATLKMGSQEKCVLGHLYGTDLCGLVLLDVVLEQREHYGFYCTDRSDYTELNKIWVELILERIAAKTVRGGAAFLSRYIPEWPWRIDVEHLDMSNVSDCLIGQLSKDFGGYVVGLKWLGLTHTQSVHYGFSCKYWSHYPAFTNAWKREIRARQKPFLHSM